MPYGNVPGILDDNPFNRNINIGPAGSEVFGGKNPPSIAGPPPSPIRPLNTAWIDPGMLLEPPSGFGGEGAGAAVRQNIGMPNFGFDFGFGMPPGFNLPPNPAPGAAQDQGGDWLSSAIKQGMDFLGSLAKKGGGSTETFFGPDAVQEGMQNEWGFTPEPKPNLGMEPGWNQLNTGLPDEALFNPSFTGVSGANAPWSAGNNALQNTIKNQFGFANEPNFSVMSGENLPALDPGAFHLGTNATLNAAPVAGPAPWVSPTLAASAAVPLITSLLTKNPQALAAAQGASAAGLMAGTIGSLAAPSTALMAGAGGLAGLAGTLSPMGVAFLPLPVGQAINAISRATGWFGHSAVPAGFFPTNDGRFMNPETGAIIERDGRFNFKVSDQTNNFQAPTPDQARQWGLPIPGVDIGFADLNPYASGALSNAAKQGTAYLRPDLMNALSGGSTYGSAKVGLDDLLEALHPGITRARPIIEALAQAQPNAGRGEIWKQYTTTPEGQAEQYRQDVINANNFAQTNR